MSKLRTQILKLFHFIGDHSGCHQLPERCFVVRGYIFPLCARCTGVFAGQAAGLFFFLAGARLPAALCFALLGIMGLDWGIQYLGVKSSTNLRRFITGIIGGFGLFQLYGHAFCLVWTLLFR